MCRLPAAMDKCRLPEILQLLYSFYKYCGHYFQDFMCDFEYYKYDYVIPIEILNHNEFVPRK